MIVGAGIGGLAAGLALRRAGWHVRIVERAAAPRELGFALLLAPNAMYALRQLGLADTVRAGGAVITSGEMRRPDGQVLRRFDATRVSAALGEDSVCVLRPALHGALLEALGEDALMLGRAVVECRIGSDSVEASCADGSTVLARVLIGADGVGSIVRRHLHPHEPAPAPSGLVAVRGVAFDVAHLLGGTTGAQYFGRGLEAGVSRASDRAVYWYLSVRASEVASSGADPTAFAARVAAGFHEPFRAIVAATTPDHLRQDILLTRRPLTTWGTGASTLVGDAAHPMLPHAGQGAAQALEDAVALGQCLAHASAPIEALREYERLRMPRTRAVVHLSQRNARMGSLTNPLACAARDLAIRMVPERIILKSLIALGRPPAAERTPRD